MRIMWMGWGIDVRFRRGYLTITWRPGCRAYFSADGTPQTASRWLWGRNAA